MPISRVIGAAVTLLGAIVFGLGLLGMWAEWLVTGGHVYIPYIPYGGWDLAEGVALWSLVVVVFICALGSLLPLGAVARGVVPLLIVTLGIAMLGINTYVIENLHDRVAADVQSFIQGHEVSLLSETEQFRLIKENVTPKKGHFPAAAGSGLVILGGIYSAIRNRREGTKVFWRLGDSPGG